MADEAREANPKPRRRALPWLLVVLLVAADALAVQWAWPKLKAADALAGSDAALNAKLADLQGENARLAAAKDALSKDVAAKEDELERLKGTYDALQQNMKDEIAKGDIQLSQHGGKLQVDLVDKLLFDSGEATISERGQEVLRRVGAVLAKIEDKQIQVSGHTDLAPISPKLVAQFPTNWELSAARAVNVVRFLSEQAGVPAKRLVASGYGPYHPIASNATPAGRARNRRIEILLTPLTQAVKNEELAAAAAQVVIPAKATVQPASVKPVSAKATLSRKPKAHATVVKAVAKRSTHPEAHRAVRHRK